MARSKGKCSSGLRSLCHHFTHCPLSLSPDLIRYCGSNSWCDVAKKLMNKCKCPDSLVPAPPKSPRMCTSSLAKTNPMEASWALLSAVDTNMQGSGVVSRGLRAFAKDCACHTSGGRPTSGEVHGNDVEEKAAAFEESLRMSSANFFRNSA